MRSELGLHRTGLARMASQTQTDCNCKFTREPVNTPLTDAMEPWQCSKSRSTLKLILRMGRFFYSLGYMNLFFGQKHGMVAEKPVLKRRTGRLLESSGVSTYTLIVVLDSRT